MEDPGEGNAHIYEPSSGAVRPLDLTVPRDPHRPGPRQEHQARARRSHASSARAAVFTQIECMSFECR